MKFAIILMILFPFKVLSYSCPSYVRHNSEAQKAQQWLERFSEVRRLHGCEVEILSCDLGETFNESAPIGEIIITTEDGYEAYLAIDFPSDESSKMESNAITYAFAFNFFKMDRNFEEIEGRTESWRFEMGTVWNKPNVLERLELGVYSTNTKLNHSNGNQSHWYVCGPS